MDVTEIGDLPKDGFFVVIVYFKEYKDNTPNDTRRSLESMVKKIRKENKVDVIHHLFALLKSVDLKYLYALLAMAEDIRQKNKGNIEHHVSAVIKKPPGGKRITRAIGAIEMIRYKCKNHEQVIKIYEDIKQWCKKRNWNYEIMFADWIIEAR